MPMIFDMIADAKKVNAAFKQTEKQLDKLDKKTAETTKKGKKGFDLLGLAIGSISFTAIAAGIGKTVQLASAAEETANKFRVVFAGVKDANTGIAEMSTKMGIAESAAQKLTSNLGDLIKPMGFSSEQAFDMSAKLTKLAGDVASFSNVSGGTAKVVEDFQSALAGGSETVTKYGMGVRVSQLAEEAMRLGLVASTKEYMKLRGEQKRNIRTQALISKMYRDSQDALGDLERTQGSFSNQSRQLGENITAAGEKIGEVFLPVITAILPYINDAIKGFTSWADNLKIIDDIITIGVAKWTELFNTFAESAVGKFLTDAVDKTKGVAKEAANWVSETEIYKTVIEETNGVLAQAIQMQKEEDALIKKQREEEEKRLLAARARAAAAEKNKVIVQETVKAFKELPPVFVALNTLQNQLTEQRNKGKEDIYESVMALKEVEKRTDKIKFKSVEWRMQLQKLTTETMTDLLFKAGSLEDKFKSIVKEMLKALAKAAIIQTIGYALGIPTGGGGSQGGGVLKTLGSAFGFANGGMIGGGMPFSGGNSRDNVLIPAQTGEMVIRRDSINSITKPILDRINQTGNAGGVGGNTYNINIAPNVMNENFVINEFIPLLNRLQATDNVSL